MENGNLNRLFDHLDARLARIEASIDRLGVSHEERSRGIELRVAALELKNATQSGGFKMLSIVAGVAASIGGIAAHLVSKWWA